MSAPGVKERGTIPFTPGADMSSRSCARGWSCTGFVLAKLRAHGRHCLRRPRIAVALTCQPVPATPLSFNHRMVRFYLDELAH